MFLNIISRVLPSLRLGPGLEGKARQVQGFDGPVLETRGRVTVPQAGASVWHRNPN